MRRTGLGLLVALLASCSDDGITPPHADDLGGEWNVETRLPGDEGGTCVGRGAYVLTVSGDVVSGDGRIFVSFCSLPAAGPLTFTRVTRDSVAFTGGGCTWIGAFLGDADSLAGTISCGGPGAGSWTMWRVGAAAVLTLTPSGGTLVPGASVALVPLLRDIHDNTLYGRPVTWSSSAAAVATVDAAGVVTAVAPGLVTITATAGGRSAAAHFGVASANFAALAAGGTFTCGRSASGAAWCWGEGGLLGNGDTVRTSGPVPVVGAPSFTALTAGVAHACGLTTTGAAWCWGRGGQGRIGDGMQEDRLQPVAVSGGLGFVQLVAGAFHTCGRTATGAAWCWGSNQYGELGDSTQTFRTAPVAVKGGLTFASIAAGWNATCGIATTGAAYCWGSNERGKAGVGGFAGDTVIVGPRAVAGGLTFTALTLGRLHACGLTTAGAAYCWGGAVYGQLGTGSRTIAVQPAAVAGGHTFSAVATMQDHTCGLDTGHALWCWGSNGAGQGGHAVATEVDVPTAVSGGLDAASIVPGAVHTCAMTTAGIAWCWGFNFNGQLGDGTRANSAVPVRVVGQT